MSLRILLLQARHATDPVAAEELREFAAKGAVDPEQIVAHDLLEGPPGGADMRGVDAVMIGGAGEFYVSKANLPNFDATLAYLRATVSAGTPMFASCFGFQCLVAALGGEIVHDPDHTEVGTYPVTLTPDGSHDPLFGRLPSTFNAQLGRKDRAERLPDGVINLARSDACTSQALRIPGKPIWATQFHPELDRDENRGRYLRYLAGYKVVEQSHDAVLERFAPSPEATSLIRAFLDIVAAGGA